MRYQDMTDSEFLAALAEDTPTLPTVARLRLRQLSAATAAQPARQPLMPEYIEQHIGADEGDREAVLQLVREVEAAHGITGTPVEAHACTASAVVDHGAAATAAQQMPQATAEWCGRLNERGWRTGSAAGVIRDVLDAAPPGTWAAAAAAQPETAALTLADWTQAELRSMADELADCGEVPGMEICRNAAHFVRDMLEATTEATATAAQPPAGALQRIEQKLLRAGASEPAPRTGDAIADAQGAGLTLALLLVRDELAAAPAEQPQADSYVCADCGAPLRPGYVCDVCESFGAAPAAGATGERG